MPASRLPIHPHPGRPFRILADLAKDGYLLHIKCNLCGCSVYFLPADLVTFIDTKHLVHIPPFACTKCKSTEYLTPSPHYPSAGGYGRLHICKLVA